MINNDLKNLCAIIKKDGSVFIIIDIDTEKEIFSIEDEYINSLNHIKISENQKYLVYYDVSENLIKKIDIDQLIKKYEITNETIKENVNVIEKIENLVLLEITDDGKVIGGFFERIKVWQFLTGSILYDSNDYKGIFAGYDFIKFSLSKNPSNEDILIASLKSCKIMIFDLVNYNVTHTLYDETGAKEYKCLIHLPDSRIASGSDDSIIRIWDPYFSAKNSKSKTNIPIKSTIPVNSNQTTNMIVTPKNSFMKNLAKSKGNLIKKRMLEEIIIQQVSRLSGHKECVVYIDYQLKKGSKHFLISGSKDYTIIVWDLKTDKEYCRFIEATQEISNLFSLKFDINFIVSSSNEGTKLWNILDKREEIFFPGSLCGSVIIKKKGKVDEILIVTYYKNKIKFWNINIIDNLGMLGAYTQMEHFCALTRFKNKTWTSSTLSKVVISPLKLTFPHMYCGLDSFKELATSLQSNCELKTNKNGKSPLHYAIEKNSIRCIDVILQYLVKLRKKDLIRFSTYCYAIRKDFDLIFTMSYNYAIAFFNSIFITIEEDLPKTASPISDLPIMLFKKSTRIYKEDFIKEIWDLNEISIEFKVCLINLPKISGSSKSIEMLTAFENTKNDKIFRTPLIKFIIEEKWKQIWWTYFFFQTALMWSNLIFLVMLLSDGLKDFLSLKICFVLINVILLFYEIAQLWTQEKKLNYFKEAWNWIDLGRVASSFAWITMHILEGYNDNFWFKLVAWIMILLNFIRGLSGFRLFDMTRFYVQLIIRSVKGVFSFLVIFVYSTIAFGVVFYGSESYKDATSFFDFIWKVPFDLSMGNFESSTSEPYQYICFFLTSLFNVIIILNLLISILGDEYDKFRIDATEIDKKEMLNGIIEIERLMFWNRNKNRYGYIYTVM